MSLLLEIVAGKSGNTDLRRKKIWSELGGTIGRTKGNDWVLPDADRYVSGKHALISYQKGVFYIEDTSVNGTYLNDAEEALAPGKLTQLSTGDKLSIGDYQVAVTVLNSEEVSDNEYAGKLPKSTRLGAVSFGVDETIDGGRDPLSLLAHGSCVESKPYEALAILHGSEASPVQVNSKAGVAQAPLDDFFLAPGVKVAAESKRAIAEERAVPSRASVFSIPEDWEGLEDSGDAPHQEVLADRRDRDVVPAKQPSVEKEVIAVNRPTSQGLKEPELKKAVRQDPLPEERASNSVSDASPLSPKYKAPTSPQKAYPDNFRMLGLGSEKVEDVVAQKWLSMLPEVLSGMMSSMHARAEVKGQMRVERTLLCTTENNPLKFSVNAQSAANNLFVDKSGSFLSPEKAFEEAFQDIHVHQIALMTAMQNTIRDMLERFNPKKLEESLDSGTKRKASFGSSKKAAYWDSYSEQYNDLCEDSDKLFQDLLTGVFAESYERAVRELKQ